MSIPLEAIEKYLSGTANETEKRIVDEWYFSFDDETVEVSDETVGLREQIGSRIHTRLQQSMALRPAKVPTYNRQTRGWAVAAAITGLLISTGYFFLTNRAPKDIAKATATISKPNTDVPPGSDKAVLTLADGSTIVLDKSINGTLAKQGNTKIIQLNTGQLSYKPSAENSSAVLFNSIRTPRGGQYQIVLPDGSKVWLNAASSIRFPTAFKGKERSVTLTGEAYFEIRKDNDMPFHVEAGNVQVQVLGTRFNLNAYADEAAIKTTLLEGSVKITSRKTSVLLRPDQQAQLIRSDSSCEIHIEKDVDTEEAMAWKDEHFQFNNAELKTIMRQIVRWYDIEVEYKGKSVDRYFTADISRSKNLSAFLKILELANISYALEGKKLTITL